MANKRVIELNERTAIQLADWLLVDDSTGTKKLSMATLISYLSYSAIIFVDQLPTTDINPNMLYLVPHTGSVTDFDEYVYRDSDWNLLGTSVLDLTAVYQTLAKAAVQDKNIPWYGTCPTESATQTKVVTTTDSKFTLNVGAKVKVKFTNSNSHATPMLNVDGTGAKNIVCLSSDSTTFPMTYSWAQGGIVEFTYDGTNWVIENSVEGVFGTTAASETSFSLDSTTKNFAVTQTGTHCITFFAGGSSTKHDINIKIGNVEIASGYVSSYERVTCQVPLRKGTNLTFSGAVGDGVNISIIKNYI